MSPSTICDGSVRHGPREVLAPAADEVVEDDDLLGAGEHELVREIGADRAGAAGDEHLAETGHRRSRDDRRESRYMHRQRASGPTYLPRKLSPRATRCLDVQAIQSRTSAQAVTVGRVR